jgi:SAM-dependent methyltransferase
MWSARLGGGMNTHSAVYGAAALYDLAFSYRDFKAESQFLRDVYQRVQGRAAHSFLELAAGPGRHAVEMLTAGVDVLALDLAPEMASYARHKAEVRKLSLPFVVGNMIEFSTPGKFDFAACLLCSASYLLTDEAFLSHLASVRRALQEDGLYILELSHPNELLGESKTQDTWTMRDDAGELDIEWRGDPAAAVKGVWDADVSLRYRPFDGSPALTVRDAARQRGFTLAQISELAERSGFVVQEVLGGFVEGMTLDDPKASHMIVLLRRS